VYPLLLDLIQWMGFGLCHQLPERSFFAGGVQVPVCARDTGIYAGFFLAFILLKAIHRGSRPAVLPPRGAMVILALFVLVMAWDGVTSYAGIRETTNQLRLLTGLTTGFALAAIVVALINSQLWFTSSRERVLGSWSELAMFVVGVPAAYFLLWTLAPLAGVVYPVFVAATIVFTFMAVNMVIVTLLPIFERRADSLRQVAVSVGLAFGLTIVQLGLAAVLRVWLIRMVESIT